jgi:hypothetical protein
MDEEEDGTAAIANITRLRVKNDGEQLVFIAKQDGPLGQNIIRSRPNRLVASTVWPRKQF